METKKENNPLDTVVKLIELSNSDKRIDLNQNPKPIYDYKQQHPLSYLSLSDLISLHGWIDDDADLIEALGGDNTAKLEKAREQMVLVHQEIERRRSLIFGGE